MLQSRAMAAEQTATTTQTCPVCGATVDTTGAEPLARIACPKCGEKVRVERSFNNFVLLETLGIGGMGTVYKARDTLLDRLVALKLLRKDLGGEIDYGTRLQQEARVAASVNHPNVIQVFSSGTDHGQFYLVMELVDHGSLDDFIEQRKRLPEELVLETGIQVAKGLRAAHAKGLIHRDVKPANILFADEHTAKIGDFGLAGVAAEKAETRGEIWGTPYYVAPERLNNQAEDLRSDIYSLGATLFHAMAGKAPIEGETNSAVALRELKNHPLDLRQIVPEVSEETARVFQRAIAPDPVKRFGSYDELVSALENAYGLLTGKEEFLARRKSKVPWLIGVAVLLLALIGVGIWAFVTRQRDRSALKAVSARAEQLIALAPLEAQAAEGRRQLLQNHYNVAGAAFARVALDAKNRQPLYDWARLQQGLAAMVGRENSQARQAFQDVQNAGERGFAPEDVDLAKFFVATAKTLSAPATVPASAVANPNGPGALAILLFALKDIAQADVTNAIPLLEQFGNAKPEGKFSWIAEYKPLAQKYLDDCRSYAAWKNESGAGANPAARLEKLRQMKKQLKTHSAISEEVSAEEKTLAGQIANQQKAESAAREQEQKKRVQQTAQKKPQWLADWKKKLIDDLNRTHFSGAIVDLTGVQYGGIVGATDQTLKMKLPYGEAELPWAKLAPKTLLAVAMSFIKANTSDAADRQWLCAVYASETGQVDAARQLGEAAAKTKPEYQQQISLLSSTPPASH
jgi:hypothetical protein